MRIFLSLLLALGSTCFAHDEVTPKPKLLQKGISVERLTGVEGESTVFKFVIPPEAGHLVIKTSGGHGDLDLFLRHGVFPTVDHYDAASRSGGAEEEIRLPNPEEGVWYILVDAFTDYAGVRLTANYTLAPGAIDLPRCVPGPGLFTGSADIQIKCSTPGAIIRYTTDGSGPTQSSPRYTKSVRLTQNTTLRVKAFKRNGMSSPEVEAWYDVQPTGTITEIRGGLPVHHLAGMAGSEHLFRITLTGHEKTVAFVSDGGPGNTELLARFGAPPTPKNFDHKSDEKENRASVRIQEPAAGELFVSLRGRTAYSGVSLSATIRADGVDLIPWQPALQPYVSVETFNEQDCEVQEVMTTAGTHTLLRFNTETRNIGSADLVMPSPENNPAFEFAECHGHYHFKGFARYRLLDGTGAEVATGRKVSFCLLDLSRWDPKANHIARFDCDVQGIQAGWADVYDGGLPGQWIDITGIPPGLYTLEITMNPEGAIQESDYSNNSASVQVAID